MNAKVSKLIGGAALASLLLVGCATTNKNVPPPPATPTTPAPTTPAPTTPDHNRTDVIEKDRVIEHKDGTTGTTRQEVDIHKTR